MTPATPGLAVHASPRKRQLRRTWRSAHRWSPLYQGGGENKQCIPAPTAFNGNDNDKDKEKDNGIVPARRLWNAQAAWKLPHMHGVERAAGINNLAGAPRMVYLQGRWIF